MYGPASGQTCTTVFKNGSNVEKIIENDYALHGYLPLVNQVVIFKRVTVTLNTYSTV
jgi:hypothetical protein